MAYANYFPQNYFPQYYGNSPMPANGSQITPNAQQTQNSGIIWVQGEASAKAYPVVSGQSVLLMDSEDSVFYIKSTDQSGMPQPLRIFDYSERKSSNSITKEEKPQPDYVSRTEFDEFKKDVKRSISSLRVQEEGEG